MRDIDPEVVGEVVREFHDCSYYTRNA